MLFYYLVFESLLTLFPTPQVHITFHEDNEKTWHHYSLANSNADCLYGIGIYRHGLARSLQCVVQHCCCDGNYGGLTSAVYVRMCAVPSLMCVAIASDIASDIGFDIGFDIGQSFEELLAAQQVQ